MCLTTFILIFQVVLAPVASAGIVEQIQKSNNRLVSDLKNLEGALGSLPKDARPVHFLFNSKGFRNQAPKILKLNEILMLEKDKSVCRDFVELENNHFYLQASWFVGSLPIEDLETQNKLQEMLVKIYAIPALGPVMNDALVKIFCDKTNIWIGWREKVCTLGRECFLLKEGLRKELSVQETDWFVNTFQLETGKTLLPFAWGRFLKSVSGNIGPALKWGVILACVCVGSYAIVKVSSNLLSGIDRASEGIEAATDNVRSAVKEGVTGLVVVTQNGGKIVKEFKEPIKDISRAIGKFGDGVDKVADKGFKFHFNPHFMPKIKMPKFISKVSKKLAEQFGGKGKGKGGNKEEINKVVKSVMTDTLSEYGFDASDYKNSEDCSEFEFVKENGVPEENLIKS
jgi:hypothetical protein